MAASRPELGAAGADPGADADVDVDAGADAGGDDRTGPAGAAQEGAEADVDVDAGADADAGARTGRDDVAREGASDPAGATREGASDPGSAGADGAGTDGAGTEGDPVADPVRARWWRRALPYVFAGGWVLVCLAGILFIGIVLPTGSEVAVVALGVDAALGLACFVLLFLRRRWPRTITLTITTVASTLSAVAVGSLIVALSSYAARSVRDGRRFRRYAFFAVVTVIVTVGGLFYDWVSRTYVTVPPVPTT